MEYLIQPEDVKEALHWRPPASPSKGRRRLLGWLVFCASAAFMFALLKSRSTHAPATSPKVVSPDTPPLYDFILPLVPWFVIVAFVCYLWWAIHRRPRKIWQQSRDLQQPQVLEVDEQGLRISNPLTETFYRWNSFTGWGETANLMLLLLSNRSRVAVPKRAAQSESDWQQFQALVNAHVREPIGGFPVIPSLPVLPPDTSQRLP